jgi:hypothetical protein
MANLKIEKSTAKKLYAESQDWFKTVLEETFGKDCFKKKDWRDIKTFEDACDELELTQEDLLHIHNNDSTDEVAYKKLKIVIAAINQGWIPNWDNDNERKWWPYFNLSSGFSFSDTDYYYVYSHTDVGSRLCFESQEKAIYTAEQFLPLYKDFLTLTK